MYKVVITKQAAKEIPLLKAAGLDKKAKALIELLKEDPLRTPPPREKLLGELSGLYSRRIFLKHRLVYEIYEEQKTVKIVSLWSHYENI